MWTRRAQRTMNKVMHRRSAIGIIALLGACMAHAQFTGGPGRGEDMAQVALSPQPTVTLSVRMHLAGPYDAATGLMNDALRALPGFPHSEPYTAAGYPHVGGGGEILDPALLSPSGPDAIVDLVVVELRSDATPATVLATRSALLQRDGDVVAANGSPSLSLPLPPGNYHVAVRHRNHLGIMTQGAIALDATPVLVDLTAAGTTTFGTEARQMLDGAYPTRALWAGDASFNGQIKYTGLNNDRDPILLRIGGNVPTAQVGGYFPEDVNLDGLVRYTGLHNDRDPILLSIGGMVPTGTRSAQLP